MTVTLFISKVFQPLTRFVKEVTMSAFLMLVASWITIPLQSQNSDNLLSLSLDELLNIRITGSTLTKESLKTVPAAVTVFSHEEITRMGFDSLEELMNMAPGFQSYRSNTGSHFSPFSSRGRRIGVASAEVLVLVDGQRLEEPRTSGFSSIIGMFPLVEIERVEFIRGPGAAVYGSNSMMGVINIITRSEVNMGGVAYGSFNRREGYFMISQPVGEVIVDLMGYINIDEGDNFSLPATYSSGRVNTDDPREIIHSSIKLRWKKTQFKFQHNQFEARNFIDGTGVSNGFNSRKGNLDSISLKQSFNWFFFDSWLRLSYARSTLNYAGQFTPEGALAPISSPSSSDALYFDAPFKNYSEFRSQFHNHWEIDKQSSFQVGIELRLLKAPETVMGNNFDTIDLITGNFPIAYYGILKETTVVQAKSNREIIGVYAQYQRDFLEVTHLTLGLRYDDFSEIGSQLSPRIGLVQEIAEHHSLKLLYGEAFRAPAENELYLKNNPLILGNPHLLPESVKSLDLIWVGQWSHTGVSLGYFESRFEDVIYQQVNTEGLIQYLNGEQSPTTGFEFELSHELNEHWLVRGTYTHICKKSELSFREAKELASLMVNYQKGDWNVNLSAIHHGERETLLRGSRGNQVKLNAYWNVNGKLRYQINTRSKIFFQAKNLFDEDYATPLTNQISPEGIPNRGREILIGMNWEY